MTEVGQSAQPRVPAQSLIGTLLPLVNDMRDNLVAAAGTLDAIPAWDAAATNHHNVLTGIDELRTNAQEWSRALLCRLQSLWSDESAQYNEYRRRVERTLRARHVAELACLFPSLRTTATSDEAGLQRAAGDETTLAHVEHMIGLGFKYDAEAEGASRRLSLLCERQLKERAVLQAKVLEHSELLVAARRADTLRLRTLLSKSLDQIEAVARQVEFKLAASRRDVTNPIYRRGANEPAEAAVTAAAAPERDVEAARPAPSPSM